MMGHGCCAHFGFENYFLSIIFCALLATTSFVLRASEVKHIMILIFCAKAYILNIHFVEVQPLFKTTSLGVR